MSVTPAKVLALAADSAYLSTRPLPTAPDGYYDWQVSGDPTDLRQGHSTLTNLANRVIISSPMYEGIRLTVIVLRSRPLRTRVALSQT
jgi:hypothetical protein